MLNECTKCKTSTCGKYCYLCGDKTTPPAHICSCGRPFHQCDNFCEDCGKYPDEDIDKQVEHGVDDHDNTGASDDDPNSSPR